jgi:hypothetical protein
MLGSSLDEVAGDFGVPPARLVRMLSIPEEQDDAHLGKVVPLRAG